MNWGNVLENASGNTIADLFIGSLVTIVITKFFEVLQQKRASIGALTLIDVEIKVNAHRLKHVLENGIKEFEIAFNRGKINELPIREADAKELTEHLSIIIDKLLTDTFYNTCSDLGNLDNQKLLERIVNLYEVGYLDFQIGFKMGQVSWKLIDAMKDRLSIEIKNSEEISKEIMNEINKLRKINALSEAIKYLVSPLRKVKLDNPFSLLYRKSMTVSEAINRGNNLLATAIVGLAGAAFVPEVFVETEMPFKIDDSLLFWLGVIAVGWYFWGKHKFQRTIVPVVFVWLGLAIKLAGVIVEFKEKDDVGDDFGGLILFLLATILITFLYIKSKKFLEK